MLFLPRPYHIRLWHFLKDLAPALLAAFQTLIIALVSIGWGVYIAGRKERLW